MIDWQQEVEKREKELIDNTQAFLQIKSVLDEESAEVGSPFGKGIREAYDWLLQLATSDGFVIRDVDGYAAHIEYGTGEEIVGILCHIDVVPEGEGWTSPPYSAEIRNGNIYARGAIDDKGPTIAAYQALKIVKELSLTLSKKVRLIIGTDEESHWRCVEHYFKHEPMPSIGFAPDADFPIIYAEKGICDIECKQTAKSESSSIVKHFFAGERLNMVPEQATAILTNVDVSSESAAFHSFLKENNLVGSIKTSDTDLELIVKGKSAHGMEPDKGINAGLILAHFINNNAPLLKKEKEFFSLLDQYFYKDSKGEHLGITFRGEEKGDLTLNIGKLRYSLEQGGQIGVNLRYPEGAPFTKIYQRLTEVFENSHFSVNIISHEEPHAVDKNHPLIEKLSKVYEEQTKEKATPIAIGGGTYARSLEAGVAFGPMFPGQIDVAHQADEYISMEHLRKMTAIYAQAIYELAK